MDHNNEAPFRATIFNSSGPPRPAWNGVGNVYQRFTAPSTTIMNVFNQPGNYSINVALESAVPVARQSPMNVDYQTVGTRGSPLPMIVSVAKHPGPNGRLNILPPPLPPSSQWVTRIRNDPTDQLRTPEDQMMTAAKPPIPPPKPTKRYLEQ